MINPTMTSDMTDALWKYADQKFLNLQLQRRSGGCGIAYMMFILQRRAGLIKLLEDFLLLFRKH